VKKAALAFRNNGEQIGFVLFDFRGGYTDLYFVPTALGHNLRLLEVTIDIISYSGTNDASLHYRSSTVKGRSLGTMISASKPRYC